jgi:signal transduction histidine kinase/ActR/RegA family two-component response regulator
MRSLPLRVLLLLLAAAAILPLLALTTVLILRAAATEREAVARGLTDAARSISVAVDREIAGSVTTLQALSASRSLEEGDLERFREQMTRALVSQRDTGWLNVRLASADGRQLVSVREPGGASPDAEPRSLQRAIATGRPTVADVYTNPALKTFTWGIRLPVLKAGMVRYVLTAAVSPHAMREALASQSAASDRVAVLYDRNGTIVYRTLNADRLIGTPITPKLAERSRAEAAGILDDVNREGTPIRTAFYRSASSGWGVGVGIPHAILFAPARRLLSVLGLTALATLLLSLLGVLLVERRIRRPMATLAAAAQTFPDSTALTAITRVAATPGARETRAIAVSFDAAARAMTRALQAERGARAEAEAANRAKDEFLAMVSHELRTPLNAVYGWARMIQAGQVKDPAQALEVIVRNTDAQVQLIDDLLDVSRVITGKMRLDVQTVHPHDVVRRALEAIGLAAAAKDIRLHTVLDPRAGPVAGDPARLQQVVWNLLANAVKFTPRGGRVQVRLQRVDSHVEIIVSDTGQGMAADVLPHVFERFRQADASSTRRHGGLGLGLALVKHLVELHGGSVAAQSAGEGQGATFVVRLPVTIADIATESVPRAHPTADAMPAVNGSRLDGLRVLIVDDDPEALSLERAILSGAGAVVRSAASSPEALEIFEHWHLDVLVSDIEMPDEDGYTLIRKIRARGADDGGKTPAVALTAYGRAQDRMLSLTAGYSMHVPKPVDPAELTMIIASIAGRPVGTGDAEVS